MVRTFVTPVRAAAKETEYSNVLVLVYLADFLKTNITKFVVI